MKKIIIFLTVICTVFYLCACGAGNTAGTTGDAAKAAGDTAGASGDTSKAADDSGKLSVVTTIFPEYDWVNVILGDKGGDADVTLLIDGGVDLHSYQPSAEDILKISESDVFIYVGGESDGWVEEVLKSASNPNLISINLLEVLGDTVKEEEIVEGMEHDHEHE
nr:zinc ABC transporter substrate-binding protein [Lachnospiraceae bacterium]